MAGADWYHKGTGIASNQGPGDDGENDNEHMDVIRQKLLNFTYTEVDQFYDPSANSTMVADAMNEGRSIVNYCGHGWLQGWNLPQRATFANAVAAMNCTALGGRAGLPRLEEVEAFLQSHWPGTEPGMPA